MSVDFFDLIAIPEVTPGTTPVDSALWFPVPLLNESIGGEPETAQSEVIGNTRDPRGQVVVGFSAEGEIQTEFKASDFDLFLESVFGKTWAADKLVIGNEDKSFSFERRYPNQSRYGLMKGMRCTALNITASYGELVTAGFTFMGMDSTREIASSVGLGSVQAASGNRSMNGSTDLTNLTVDGSSAHGLIIKSLDLTMDNQAEAKNQIGNLFPYDIAQLSASITGSMEMYVSQESIDLYSSITTNTPIALKYRLTDGTTEYEFDLPELYLSGGLPKIEGRNEISMQTIEFTAAYNATAGYSIQLDRAPA